MNLTKLEWLSYKEKRKKSRWWSKKQDSALRCLFFWYFFVMQRPVGYWSSKQQNLGPRQWEWITSRTQSKADLNKWESPESHMGWSPSETVLYSLRRSHISHKTICIFITLFFWEMLVVISCLKWSPFYPPRIRMQRCCLLWNYSKTIDIFVMGRI